MKSQNIIHKKKTHGNIHKSLIFTCFWLVGSSIQFSNTFIEDLLKVYEFAEKNSPYL